ncbi:unnamed protein product [Haemonchus placei]|uniref:Liprin-beta-1/2 coiled-coil domain-containing protein n=1 Tax=Haemonchus placei TaxID=6290 RepID=A0A158QKN8_HAEPC|nr:unnamed protein product [Haemonchus placei]
MSNILGSKATSECVKNHPPPSLVQERCLPNEKGMRNVDRAIELTSAVARDVDDDRSTKTGDWSNKDWGDVTERSGVLVHLDEYEDNLYALGSDGSSEVESPPSDIPTSSSSLFNHPKIYCDFVKAIEEHAITERPDLETQLKIMRWLVGSSLLIARGMSAQWSIIPSTILSGNTSSQPSFVSSSNNSQIDVYSNDQQYACIARSTTNAIAFRESFKPIRSVVLPYVTQHSDSGFDSALSSGSSYSYLPPPPPYRRRSKQHKIHRSFSDSKYSIQYSAKVATASVQRRTCGIRWNSQCSLSPSPSMSTVSCPEYPELQEKLHRLAMARDSLSLQVASVSPAKEAGLVLTAARSAWHTGVAPSGANLVQRPRFTVDCTSLFTVPPMSRGHLVISDRSAQECFERQTAMISRYLQVSVLSEQVGAQKEKIRDLEALLAAKRNSLTSSEELIHGKYNHGGESSDMDPKKLNLMAEVSCLKLKFATLEQEKSEAERKLKLSQDEIDHVNQSIHGKAVQKPSRSQANGGSDRPTYLPALRENRLEKQDEELQQLRHTVQHLLADNEQKNHQIKSLRNALELRSREEPSEPMTHSTSFPVRLCSSPYNLGAIQVWLQPTLCKGVTRALALVRLRGVFPALLGNFESLRSSGRL